MDGKFFDWMDQMASIHHAKAEICLFRHPNVEFIKPATGQQRLAAEGHVVSIDAHKPLASCSLRHNLIEHRTADKILFAKRRCNANAVEDARVARIVLEDKTAGSIQVRVLK
jgi:hypothetical protein